MSQRCPFNSHAQRSIYAAALGGTALERGFGVWMRDGETKLPGFAPFIRGGTPVRLSMANKYQFCRAGIFFLRFLLITTHARGFMQ